MISQNQHLDKQNDVIPLQVTKGKTNITTEQDEVDTQHQAGLLTQALN
jgi:hypothetical protein